MDTPICDFVKDYAGGNRLRLHMPGHKGQNRLGVEEWDITEVDGADVLYEADGIIKQSMENAAALFSTARTLYSTEGSSLSIRAMLYLALLWGKTQGKRPLIAAGRNAHRVFMTAVGLLDAEVAWLYPEQEDSLLSCTITPDGLEQALSAMDEKPVAVYITSPDYLGNLADIGGLSEVCHRYGALLLVDNAHGAYRQFLPTSRHPIALGADLCCDSAHKTLPVLTGGGYLHIAKSAPSMFCEQAEQAMALFASTSPSYLILQSLDGCNRYLAEGYRERLSAFVGDVAALKERVTANGYGLVGEEELKLTIAPKSYGYTGQELAALLQKQGIVCEFADPDFAVMMLTPDIGADGLRRLEEALLAIPSRKAISLLPPPIPKPEKALSIRQTLLSPSVVVPVAEAKGRVLATANVSCPPAIPVAVCGEVIDEAAIRCFDYYGISTCRVVKD